MAATRALHIVVLKVLQLRPPAQLGLRAPVALLAAIRAAAAVVAEVARPVARLGDCRRRRSGGESAHFSSQDKKKRGKTEEESLPDLVHLQPLVAEVQRVLSLVPKAAMEVGHELRRARRRRGRDRHRRRRRAARRREAAVEDVQPVLAAARLRRVARAGHVAALIPIRGQHTRGRELVRAPALPAVLGACEAEAERDARRRADVGRLVRVAALDGRLQRAVGDRVGVAPERHAVVELLGLRERRAAVVQVHVFAAAAGEGGVAGAGGGALRGVDEGGRVVVEDVAAPALEGVFEAGVLEAHGEAGGLAERGRLHVFRDLRVEGQGARGEAQRVGVAAEIHAGGGCCRCDGGTGRG